MKHLFITLFIGFVGLLFCTIYVSCNKTYKAGNSKEQAIVKVYMKENNFDFNDYYIRNDKQTDYHQGLVQIDSITHDTIMYVDLNSVVYEYGNKKERYNNVIFLIDKGECLSVLDYLNYVSDYGEEKYYNDYCKQIKK